MYQQNFLPSHSAILYSYQNNFKEQGYNEQFHNSECQKPKAYKLCGSDCNSAAAM